MYLTPNQVFKLAIEKKFFNNKNAFMCNAIDKMRSAEYISQVDADIALGAIREFICSLGPNGTLNNHLIDVWNANGDSQCYTELDEAARFYHQKFIYENWDHRFEVRYPLRTPYSIAVNDVENLFNEVIDAGKYPVGSVYMCNTIKQFCRTLDYNDPKRDVCDRALREIESFIGGGVTREGTMNNFLKHHLSGLVHAEGSDDDSNRYNILRGTALLHDIKIAIYRNWSDRHSVLERIKNDQRIITKLNDYIDSVLSAVDQPMPGLIIKSL